MYYKNTLMGAVDDLFAVDDRLGVELMGAQKWNTLKRMVTNSTINALRMPKTTRRVFSYVADPVATKLFGFNDRLGEELLGGWWTDLKNSVASGTHKILEAGENIPIADAAVERFRDIASVFNFGSKAASSASSAYVWWEQNKWKVIIIGGAVIVGGVYLLGRRGRK